MGLFVMQSSNTEYMNGLLPSESLHHFTSQLPTTMSRNFRNHRPPENWPSGHQEYWIYMPTHFVSGPERSMNPIGQRRDPRWLFEEISLSLPYSPVHRHLEPLLLIDEYSTYPGAQSPTPRYDQVSTTEDHESRLSPLEQKQAINKLRKQLYSPHIDNIIKRLGTKTTGTAGSSGDDGTKRCAVCLDDFERMQFVTITPCNHMFHEDCIVPWVKSQGKCPVCRYTIK